MTTALDANDIAGRLIHYAEWIERAETPKDHAARIYAVLHGACGEEHFLSVFNEFWNGWVPAFRARTDELIAARLGKAGRDAMAQSAAERDAYLTHVHQWAIYFWQRGGVGGEDARQEYLEYEGTLNEMAYQLALDSTIGDDEVVQRSRANIKARAAAKDAMKELSEEDLDMWLELRVRPGFVSEAHRRLRYGERGEILRNADVKARTLAKTPEEYTELRRGLVDVLFDRR